MTMRTSPWVRSISENSLRTEVKQSVGSSSPSSSSSSSGIVRAGVGERAGGGAVGDPDAKVDADAEDASDNAEPRLVDPGNGGGTSGDAMICRLRDDKQ